LASVATEVLRSHADIALQYGDLEGYAPLRELIAQWLGEDGIDADPRNVIIVTGAKQSLEMTTHAVCSPGDRIAVGAPTYFNGLRIFKALGLDLCPVPHDEFGIDVDAFESSLRSMSANNEPLPKIVYDVPDFHNPTGTVLSFERRDRLVQVARRFGLHVLEDNPYRWTRFDGTALPPLGAFDRNGSVISTGTFSKILGPGLRLGWVHANRKLIDRLLPYKTDGGTSPLCQMIAYEFYRQPGTLARHLGRVRHSLRMKRDATDGALRRAFADSATWTYPSGGYYVWVTMNAPIDTDSLAAASKRQGVEFLPGSMFYPMSTPPTNRLRLAYSFESAERIADGVSRIGELAQMGH
jgi:2-aminoadipate transaminase